MHHAVAASGECGVVGDENQRRAALLVTGKQQIDDLGAGRLVQIAGRLVGNEDRRPWSKCAGERHALLLTSGKLRRIVMWPLAQTDGGKLAQRPLLGAGDAGKLERNGDVFQRRHGWYEVKGLEHDPDIAAAEASEGVFTETAERRARNHHRAFVSVL